MTPCSLASGYQVYRDAAIILRVNLEDGGDKLFKTTGKR
jgi:hypothetical protein